MKKNQQGFLLIAAIVIIFIFAIISASLVAISMSSNLSTTLRYAGHKAQFLAESGLEFGAKQLTEPTISSRQTCGGLSNTTSLATGSFTVNKANDAGNSVNPRYAFSTLSSAITTSSISTITVASSSVFAPNGGRVLIDREVFRYLSIPNSTTLAVVSRGEDGSFISSHASGAIVSQYQCTLQSTGQSPASSPSGIQSLREGVTQPVLFAVGATGKIFSWNDDSSELAWQNVTSPTAISINAISALNYHTAWAVSSKQAKNTTRFFKLAGSSWSADSSDPSSDKADLLGVSAVSEQEVWAVGLEQGKDTYSLLRRFNGSWCLLSTTTSGCGGKYYTSANTYPGIQDLMAVEVIDTDGDGFGNFGFATGGITSGATKMHILGYNGTQWTKVDQISNAMILYGIKIMRNGSQTPKEAWAVGSTSSGSQQGIIMKWTSNSGLPGTWSVVTNTTPNFLYSVDMIDTNNDGLADFGIAVGVSGQMYTYNGSTWSGPTTISANDLNKVVIIKANDIWVVGNSGTRLHYDGTSWVSITTGVTTSVNLEGMDAVFPKETPVSAWYDVVN